MLSGAILFSPEHLKRVGKVRTIIPESKRFYFLFYFFFVTGQKMLTNTFCKILNCLLFKFFIHLICT